MKNSGIDYNDFGETLPSYPLPAGYITKQQAINIALKAAEAHLHKGEVAKNIQCLLLPYGIGYKILYGNPEITKEKFRFLENKRLSREELENYMKKYYAYDSRLMYFIIMDVKRYPGEALIRFAPNAVRHIRLINGKYITTQDTYVIDAKIGNIVGHGYYGSVKHIYPKQN